MKALKYGLTAIALALSLSAEAKGLLDALIDKAVDKVAEAVLKDRPATVAAPQPNDNSTGSLNTNSIPEEFHGTWGLIEGKTNRCQDDMGMGIFIIDATNFSGYEMSYAFKNQIQGLSNGTFIGRFKNDSGYGEPNEEADMEFSLVGTDKLRWDDNLLVKCSASDKAKREQKLSSIESNVKTNSAESLNEMDYNQARVSLIKMGWKPKSVCKPSFLPCKDYPEIDDCSGTGKGYCGMVFYKTEHSCLSVTTVGGAPSKRMRKGDVTVDSIDTVACQD